jgi:hypothetical protein
MVPRRGADSLCVDAKRHRGHLGHGPHELNHSGQDPESNEARFRGPRRTSRVVPVA